MAIDATCPLVTKVHREAERFSRTGFHILLVGHEGHEEVEGTMGHAPDQTTLVNNPDEADVIEVPETDKLIWLSQTTLSVDETMETVRRLRLRFPHLQDPPSDDICYATQNRQVAIKKIAPECDLVLIVGSSNSSNSVRLVEVALEVGARASYRIDYASEVKQEWFDGVETVGISSGASVPEHLVDELLSDIRLAGFNHVDLAAARELGITVTRVPAYSPYAVAEHTVALVLALNRRIHRAFNRVREQNFSLAGLVGFDLHGKTCGIVGTGKIGRVAAEIFKGFGMRMVAHDPFPQADWAAAHGIEYLPLDDLLAASDIVSLHLPLTPETNHLVNATTLARMKPGAMLVNTSRGKLIDTAAVIAALKTGRLGGLAIDVYEEEEGVFFEDLSGQVLQDDELARLLTFPNVLVTAHQAFLTQEALGEIARVTIENLLRVGRGEPPLPGTVVEDPAARA